MNNLIICNNFVIIRLFDQKIVFSRNISISKCRSLRSRIGFVVNEFTSPRNDDRAIGKRSAENKRIYDGAKFERFARVTRPAARSSISCSSKRPFKSDNRARVSNFTAYPLISRVWLDRENIDRLHGERAVPREQRIISSW